MRDASLGVDFLQNSFFCKSNQITVQDDKGDDDDARLYTYIRSHAQHTGKCGTTAQRGLMTPTVTSTSLAPVDFNTFFPLATPAHGTPVNFNTLVL